MFLSNNWHICLSYLRKQVIVRTANNNVEMEIMWRVFLLVLFSEKFTVCFWFIWIFFFVKICRFQSYWWSAINRPNSLAYYLFKLIYGDNIVISITVWQCCLFSSIMFCSVRISAFLVDASDLVKASMFNLISSDVVLLWENAVLKQIRLVVIA